MRIRAGVATAAILIAAVFFSFAPPCVDPGAVVAAASKPPVPFDIYAGAWVKPDKDAPPAPGSKVARSNLKGVSVTVEYAPPARRAEFLKSIDAGIGDPFAPSPGRPDRVVAFIVTFNNQSREQLVFNPGNVAVVSDKGERAFPLDLTDMYIAAERQGAEDLQAVIDRSGSVMFDSSTVIPAGTGMTRLVVFRPIEGKWKQFQLHFAFLQIGRDTHTLSFTFHKREQKG